MGTSVSALLTVSTASANTAPGPAIGLTASSVNLNSFMLTWTAPTVGLPVSYQPQIRPSGTSTWGNYPTSGAILGTSITITGLSPATQYDVQVVTKNNAGNTPSSLLTVTTTAAPPVAPTGLTATAVSVSDIHVAWIASTTPAVTYSVSYRTPPTTGTYTVWPTPTTATSLDVTGLATATAYEFQVTATNTAASTPAATSVVATTQSGLTLPSAPTSLSVGSATGTTLTASWITPAAGNGTITYAVQYSPTGANTWATAGTTNDPTTTYTITNLLSGTAYDVHVIASNAAGSGPASAIATAQTISSGNVRNPYLVPGSNNSMWVTPLGSGAVWSGATDADTQALIRTPGTVNAASYGIAIYVAVASDPMVTFTSTTGASGQRDANLTVTMHCPANAAPSPPYPGGDCQMVIFDPVTQPGKMYCFANCTFNNGADVTGGVTAVYGEVDLICGTMEDANTGNFGINAGVGVIRASDLDSTQSPNGITHGLRFACSASQLLPPPTWTTTTANGTTYIYWPQTHSDFNGPTVYTGSLPSGATVGIPAGQAMPAGLSAGGQLAWANAQTYGWHWRDTGGNGLTLYATPDLESNALIAGIRGDLVKIAPYLRVLRNQGPATVQGGGTPVAAGPPPVDPTVCGSPTAPGQVSGVSLNSSTATSATLSWAQPSGSLPMTYVIQASAAGANVWNTTSGTIAGALFGTITGLTAGANVDLRIIATNNAGNGTASATLTVQLPAAAAPVTFSPTATTNTITLSTDLLTATTGTANAGYSQTAVSSTAQSTGKLFYEFLAVTLTSHFAIGLCNANVTNGANSFGSDASAIAYYPINPLMGIYFQGAALDGAYSNQTPIVNGVYISVAVDLDAKLFWVTDPAMRSAFGATAWNDNSTASPATGVGGASFAAMTGPYLAVFNDGDAGAVVTLNVGATPFSLAMPSGFAAWNGNSVDVAVSVPGQVTGLTTTTITANSVSLSWAAVAATGAQVSYQLQQSGHNAATWVNSGSSTLLTSAIASGLTASSIFDFQVIATNSAGSGPASTTISATTESAAGSTGPLITAPLTGTVTAGAWQLTSYNNTYYWVLLPANYDSTQTYPLILYLHQNGAGTPFYANGSSGTGDLVKPQIDPWFNSAAFRTNHPCFVVAPLLNQTSDSSGQTINWGGITSAQQASQINYVNFIAYATHAYPINANYIFCTGNGMGGVGAWDCAVRYNLTTGTNAKLFAAYLILAGAVYTYGYPTPSTSLLASLQAVPIWAIHGGQDAQIPLLWDQNVYLGLGGTTAYNGAQAANGLMRYTQDPNLGSDVWDTYYVEPIGETYWTWMFGAPTGTSTGTGSIIISADKTTIQAGGGQTITDAAGNLWTITAQAQVGLNGVAQSGTSAVVELAYVSGVVWELTTTNNWYSMAAQNNAVTITGGPTAISPLTAPPNGTTGTKTTNQFSAQFALGFN